MKKSTSDEGSRGPCADVAVDTRHQTAENGVPYARGPRSVVASGHGSRSARRGPSEQGANRPDII